jgi:hypothetical protein
VPDAWVTAPHGPESERIAMYSMYLGSGVKGVTFQDRICCDLRWMSCFNTQVLPRIFFFRERNWTREVILESGRTDIGNALLLFSPSFFFLHLGDKTKWEYLIAPGNGISILIITSTVSSRLHHFTNYLFRYQESWDTEKPNVKMSATSSAHSGPWSVHSAVSR